MIKDYIDTLKLAKAKGYKPEFTVSLEQIEIDSQFGADYPEEGRYITLCLVQKWLREEKGIDVLVRMDDGDRYRTDNSTALQSSYEKALLQGIYEALKLI